MIKALFKTPDNMHLATARGMMEGAILGGFLCWLLAWVVGVP